MRVQVSARRLKGRGRPRRVWAALGVGRQRARSSRIGKRIWGREGTWVERGIMIRLLRFGPSFRKHRYINNNNSRHYSISPFRAILLALSSNSLGHNPCFCPRSINTRL